MNLYCVWGRDKNLRIDARNENLIWETLIIFTSPPVTTQQETRTKQTSCISKRKYFLIFILIIEVKNRQKQIESITKWNETLWMKIQFMRLIGILSDIFLRHWNCQSWIIECPLLFINPKKKHKSNRTEIFCGSMSNISPRYEADQRKRTSEHKNICKKKTQRTKKNEKLYLRTRKRT